MSIAIKLGVKNSKSEGDIEALEWSDWPESVLVHDDRNADVSTVPVGPTVRLLFDRELRFEEEVGKDCLWLNSKTGEQLLRLQEPWVK